jgi:hypothetical protein
MYVMCQNVVKENRNVTSPFLLHFKVERFNKALLIKEREREREREGGGGDNSFACACSAFLPKLLSGVMV